MTLTESFLFTVALHIALESGLASRQRASVTGHVRFHYTDFLLPLYTHQFPSFPATSTPWMSRQRFQRTTSHPSRTLQDPSKALCHYMTTLLGCLGLMLQLGLLSWLLQPLLVERSPRIPLTAPSPPTS